MRREWKIKRHHKDETTSHWLLTQNSYIQNMNIEKHTGIWHITIAIQKRRWLRGCRIIRLQTKQRNTHRCWEAEAVTCLTRIERNWGSNGRMLFEWEAICWIHGYASRSLASHRSHLPACQSTLGRTKAPTSHANTHSHAYTRRAIMARAQQ